MELSRTSGVDSVVGIEIFKVFIERGCGARVLNTRDKCVRYTVISLPWIILCVR